MKIAFIGQKGIPALSGGVERRVEELAVRMAAMGHEVFVYARKKYNPGAATSHKGVKVIYLPSIPRKNLDAITHVFLATVHALFQNYDVINYQAPGPSTLSWIIRIFKRKTAVVGTFNSEDRLHQKWGWLAQKYLHFGEYAICNFSHKIIAISNILKISITEKYKKDAIVIPNGADVVYTENSDTLKIFGLEDRKYFLYLGRLIQHKGVHYLIEAFKELKQNGNLPEGFKLAIAGIGAFTDGYVNHLKMIGRDDKDVIFMGELTGERRAQAISHAYAFVQPSEAEGLSIALLEAMGCGVAPLVSDIRENMEPLMGHGFSFRNKDVNDLADKMKYLAANPGLVTQTGIEAEKIVAKKYNWDIIAKQTADIFQQAINSLKAS